MSLKTKQISTIFAIFADSMYKMRNILIFILVAVAGVSCGEYQRIYKKGTAAQKQQKAMELYGKKEYAKSVQLLEQLRDMYKVRDSLENVYYHMAMSYYHLKDYPYASLFFKDYTDNFTQADRVIECAYMSLYCDVLAIGPADLDQADTKKVMEALQMFTNYYPDSEYAQKCNDHIDLLRGKLQKKEFEMAEQYYLMGEFKSAAVAAKNTVKLYPDMQQRETLEWMAVDAQFQYAENSIKSKRLERFQMVLENIQDYLYTHPEESSHHSAVKKIEALTKKRIKEIEAIL